jgi:NAD(P)-dependent dehydrogenase (short-subunit alcohol dehydrogenase family)
VRLEGKTALITGAGTGIGRATALLFAEEGADVVVADLDRADAEETAAAVRSAGRRAVALVADLAKPAELYAMLDQAIAAFDGIDILVNNAGVGKVPARTLELDDLDAWDRVMAVNVRAVFLCSQGAARWIWPTAGARSSTWARRRALPGCRSSTRTGRRRPLWST